VNFHRGHKGMIARRRLIVPRRPLFT
jgi:hypothetical protein